MEEKKKLMLNCEVCDSTKVKEENYSHYEEITINAELLVVNEVSKGILNRLPIRLNIERTIEFTEEPEIKIINGAYEITEGMMPQKPVIPVVNGFLKVRPGTEEILKKYVCMIINGTAEFPESLKGSMDKMIINGQVRTYPDDSVMLEDDYIMDSYFPIRAREGLKYFARNAVIIRDADVDISKLIQKNVKLLTPRLVVPESRLEESAVLVDANVDFVVVPEGLSLICGDAVLGEDLIRREGGKLFVYGDLRLDEKVDMEMLQTEIDTLVVTGNITLNRDQKEGFQKIHARYQELRVIEQERLLQGMVEVRLNKKLFECSPNGIRIDSAVKVVIEEDVTPEMLLHGLKGVNCLQIECNEEQETALYSMGVSPGLMQRMTSGQTQELTPGRMYGMPEAEGAPSIPAMPVKHVPDMNQVINAESYVM